MKILFLTDNFPPEVNASASRVYERALYWVKWGHEVTILTSAPNFPEGKVYAGYKNKWYQKEEIDGLTVIRIKTFIAKNKGTFRRVFDFLSYMCMAIFVGLFMKKKDVIVATSPQFFAAVAGYVLAVFKRSPFVFELGDLWPESISAVGVMRKGFGLRLLEKLELFLYGRASAVIALTNAFKKNLVARGIKPEKIHVVINGVELSKFSQLPVSNELLKEYGLEGKFIIGYIGTHGMAHGLANVLLAANVLQLSEPNVHFLFVGAGAERDDLMAQAQKQQLKNVLFVAKQPKEKINYFWSICHVALVHLKYNAAFSSVIPSKIFEAMAMGLPIILASPKGEASDIIAADDVGLWASSESPSYLIAAIRQLSADRQSMDRYSKNSLVAASHHTREKQAQAVIKVLESIVERVK